MVSNKTDILQFDLRCDPAQSSTLLKNKSLVTSICNVPSQPFQSFLTTQARAIIIDSRIAGRSLIEWNLNDSYEQQFFSTHVPWSIDESSTCMHCLIQQQF
jgi:hypothetical protein